MGQTVRRDQSLRNNVLAQNIQFHTDKEEWRCVARSAQVYGGSRRFNYRRRDEGAFEEVRNRGGSRSYNVPDSQAQTPKLSLGNKYGALSQDQSWKRLSRWNQTTCDQYYIVAPSCFMAQPRRENLFSRLGRSVYYRLCMYVHMSQLDKISGMLILVLSSAILKLWDGSSILGICTHVRSWTL